MGPVAELRRAAIAEGDGVDIEAQLDHALHSQMWDAVEALRNHDDQGLVALKTLAKDPSPHVRQWAAAELLSRGEICALEVLEELATNAGALRLNAQTLLNEYRAGRLKSPFASFRHAT